MYVFENEYGLGTYIPSKMIFFQKLSKIIFKSVQCLRFLKKSQHSYFETLNISTKIKKATRVQICTFLGKLQKFTFNKRWHCKHYLFIFKIKSESLSSITVSISGNCCQHSIALEYFHMKFDVIFT